jgi:hypothetical protein
MARGGQFLLSLDTSRNASAGAILCRDSRNRRRELNDVHWLREMCLETEFHGTAAVLLAGMRQVRLPERHHHRFWGADECVG